MKKFLIVAATLATAVSVAAPAAAQYYPPQPQGYAYGYNNQGYNTQGYNNQGRGYRLEARVQQIRREIRQLDRADRLSKREARRLDREAQFLQQRIQRLAYNGVNRNERQYVERQLAQLETRVRREVMDGNARYGNQAYGYNGYNNSYGYPDRDRDGRDDRREDDRGYDHD